MLITVPYFPVPVILDDKPHRRLTQTLAESHVEVELSLLSGNRPLCHVAVTIMNGDTG